MSLHGYDALRIEFPSRLLADSVAAGLAICSALTIEAVAARYPEPRMGLGIAALALLTAWLWYRHAWLTPRDVPAPQLRELAVRLVAARVREGA
jgi:hypothetical protein